MLQGHCFLFWTIWRLNTLETLFVLSPKHSFQSKKKKEMKHSCTPEEVYLQLLILRPAHWTDHAWANTIRLDAAHPSSVIYRSPVSEWMKKSAICFFVTKVLKLSFMVAKPEQKKNCHKNAFQESDWARRRDFAIHHNCQALPGHICPVCPLLTLEDLSLGAVVWLSGGQLWWLINDFGLIWNFSISS